ncbi:ABC transporter ATP-binding protein [Streptomyces albus subsp. chlorinus]|uniref:dipeptide ABC transporter ATP-binding protein n=1 Tax=Streptomyces albus TaxID=1888 RepID=UPI001570BE30|nr:ABC transporter ATP-binding protein [Streptomyces albus]NSC24071.1 ABC transporter ATP-binding protein [Streptomyces albus subsp. chlorinus]
MTTTPTTPAAPAARPGTTAPLLEIEDLHLEIAGRDRTGAERTVRALDGVSLRLAPGEALGLVGESGSGKTMTALSVLGLLPPGARVTSGRVLLEGTDLAAAGERVLRGVRGDSVGVVFQDPLSSLNPTMTIGAQVAEPLLLHRGVGRAEARERAREMLRLVGLPQPGERMKSYPHQLSGGMRQRVAIAMALVCEPKLLIADEPTTALDVTTQHQILELLGELRERLGMAVVLVSHDLGVIARRVDRVAVMYAGRVAEQAPVRQLFTAPRHRYTQALFDALPERAAGTGRPLATIPGLPPSLTRPPAGCRFAPRCAYATDECRTQEPPVRAADEGGRHTYACFHPAAPGRPSPREPAATTAGTANATTAATAITAGTATAPGAGTDAEADVLLELDAVRKEYALRSGPFTRRGDRRPVSAVAGVSLTVRRGETFGIVGESGCGKSTLGRMAVGMERPTGGAVRFEGRDVATLDRAALRAHRRRVQLMFQDSYAAMDPRMRVGAILREPLVVQGVGDRAAQEARVRELLDEVGLPQGAVHRYPHEFSGGQRQRLGLARALALSPSLVVADEPVSALDVSVQAQILNLMRDLQREKGLSYLFISHDLAVVRYLADRVGVMYLGSLVETGPAAEVFARPLHPYTRGLLETADSTVLDGSGEHGEHGGPGGEPLKGKPLKGEPLKGETPSAADPPSGCRFRTRCPLATELCATTAPEPTAPVAEGHLVSCHFPLVGAA